jgi:hypothetical protein
MGTSNSRHSLRIERMDNGYSVEHSRQTWPTGESEYGGYDTKGKSSSGRRSSENWRKIASDVNELHDLVDESFGTSRKEGK